MRNKSTALYSRKGFITCLAFLVFGATHGRLKNRAKEETGRTVQSGKICRGNHRLEQELPENGRPTHQALGSLSN